MVVALIAPVYGGGDYGSSGSGSSDDVSGLQIKYGNIRNEDVAMFTNQFPPN